MATPTTWPHRFVRRPPSSSTTAPASGNTSRSHAARCTPAAARGTSVGTAAARAATAVRVPVTPTPLCRPRRTTPGAPVSILEQVRVVHRRGPAGVADGAPRRQTPAPLRGRDHHDEEGDDLPVYLAVLAREGDKRQVDRVQHELDAHEDDHRVAADQDSHRTDHEQDHGERHVVSGAHDRPPFCPFPLASSPAEYAGWPTPVGPGWGGLSDWSAPSGPAGSAPDASRRASLTASRAPGRPWTTGLTDSADGVPSGSSAGKSTALWRAGVGDLGRGGRGGRPPPPPPPRPLV